MKKLIWLYPILIIIVCMNITDDNKEKVDELKLLTKKDKPSLYEDVRKLPKQPIKYATDIPVLNYHFFYNDDFNNCNEEICLAASKFEEQLKYLVDNGYKTLTMTEFINWYEGRIEVPDKSVLITVDDGAMGTSFINGNILIPLLEKYKVHATLFLITAWWNKENYQSPYLDVESHGHDIHFIGSCRGPQIKCLNYDELYDDFKKSINNLDSSKAFAYPFYVSTEIAEQVLADLGFKVAFGGEYRNASRDDYRYYIPRHQMCDSITLDQFIQLIK